MMLSANIAAGLSDSNRLMSITQSRLDSVIAKQGYQLIVQRVQRLFLFITSQMTGTRDYTAKQFGQKQNERAGKEALERAFFYHIVKRLTIPNKEAIPGPILSRGIPQKIRKVIAVLGSSSPFVS